jgi:hypothetical protein
MSGVGGSRSRLVFGRGFLGWRVVLVTWLVVVGSLVGTAGAWARPPGPTGRPGGPPGRHGLCQVHISRHRIHISKHRVHISKKNYGSLQSAVSAAAPGAKLTVRGDCVGTTEIQKGLTIVGSKAKGFGSPTLDGNRAGSVVKVDPSVDPNVVIAIANLTITNGHAQNGGGVSVVGARVMLTSVQINDNTARGAGGGLYVNSPIGDPVGAEATCTHCTITGNKADYGGGVALINSTLNMKASTVQGNTASTAGGGVYLFGGITPPFPTARQTAPTRLRSIASVHPDITAGGIICPNGVVILPSEEQVCPAVGGWVDFTVVSGNTAPTESNLSNNGGTVTTDSTSTVAIFEQHVFWANSKGGTIVEAGFDGDGLTTIATGGEPRDVAVDPLNNHLYWHTGSEIVEANLDGTNQQTIATGQLGSSGMAVGAGHLYWADAEFGIVEANLDGTDPQTLATDSEPGSQVAVGGSLLYWTNPDDGTIHQANLDGTNQQTIATGQDDPRAVTAPGNLYWANAGLTPNSGTIVEANHDGTNQHTIATGQDDPSGVAAVSVSGGGGLFWTNFGDGEVINANPDGSDPEFIASGQGPGGIAIGP